MEPLQLILEFECITRMISTFVIVHPCSLVQGSVSLVTYQMTQRLQSFIFLKDPIDFQLTVFYNNMQYVLVVRTNVRQDLRSLLYDSFNDFCDSRACCQQQWCVDYVLVAAAGSLISDIVGGICNWH